MRSVFAGKRYHTWSGQAQGFKEDHCTFHPSLKSAVSTWMQRYDVDWKPLSGSVVAVAASNDSFPFGFFCVITVCTALPSFNRQLQTARKKIPHPESFINLPNADSSRILDLLTTYVTQVVDGGDLVALPARTRHLLPSPLLFAKWQIYFDLHLWTVIFEFFFFSFSSWLRYSKRSKQKILSAQSRRQCTRKLPRDRGESAWITPDQPLSLRKKRPTYVSSTQQANDNDNG